MLNEFNTGNTLNCVTEHDLILQPPIGPIQDEFEVLLLDACNAVVRVAALNLDGIYVCGSVATGTAVVGKSELVLCIVLRHDEPESIASLEVARGDLQKRHPVVRSIKFEVVLLEEVLAPINHLNWAHRLRYQFLSIWGVNLAERFLPHRRVGE